MTLAPSPASGPGHRAAGAATMRMRRRPMRQHGELRKQRRGVRARTEPPPLRPAARRARAASASDSEEPEETADDSGRRQTRDQGKCSGQEEHRQTQAGSGGDEIEDGRGIQRRAGTPDSEVQSEEDPSAGSQEFEPDEACSPHALAVLPTNMAMPRSLSWQCLSAVCMAY